MPKLKTRKAAAKRYKKTAAGNFLRHKAQINLFDDNPQNNTRFIKRYTFGFDGFVCYSNSLG